MIMINDLYKWTVFAYITVSMVLYLGGFWPFTQSIVDKSWVARLPDAARYTVVSIILALCCGLFMMLLIYTLKMKVTDPYILLSTK